MSLRRGSRGCSRTGFIPGRIEREALCASPFRKGTRTMKSPYATTIAGASLAGILAGCAASNVGTNPLVPENLKVPAGQTLSLVAPATGVQIYECGAIKTEPARFEWVFKAPEADLFDLSGKKIGKHYAGPTWESNDGSKVVGEVKARDDGPAATAIPWLMLSAKATSGNGAFSRTQAIQRLYTVGGKAPAAGCKPAQTRQEGPGGLKGTYFFYRPQTLPPNADPNLARRPRTCRGAPIR